VSTRNKDRRSALAKVKLILVALLLPLACVNAAVQDRGSGQARFVVINKERLSDEKVRALEVFYKTHVLDGKYWYDPVSGAWGLEGGPTKGFIRAGHKLGGALRSDASNGRTGVFVNGRELHRLDVLALQSFVQVVPGRYWVDSRGNGGYERGPAFFNLIELARAAGVIQRGNRSAISDMYDSGIGRVLGDGSYIGKE